MTWPSLSNTNTGSPPGAGGLPNIPPLLFNEGKPTAPGKVPAANSIEPRFKDYKDKKGAFHPWGVLYAVELKTWHTQRVFDMVWMPHV